MWLLIISALTYATIYTVIEMNINKKYKHIQGVERIKLDILIYVHAVLYYIISFSIIFFVLDRKTNKNAILMYIIGLIMLLVHWAANDNKCFLTELMNEYFGFPENDNFRTPVDMIYGNYPQIAISQRVQNEYITICGVALFATMLYLT